MFDFKNINAPGFALWQKYPKNGNLIKILHRRAVLAVVFICIVFIGILWRLINIMVISSDKNTNSIHNRDQIIKKADIIDRNGELLATSITTSSCFADPSVVIDLNETIKKLSRIPGMPKIDKIRHKLKDRNKHFVWLMRHVHPTIEKQIMDMGIPGIHFQKDYKRIYIHGNLFSHVIGCTDIDCNGVCGIEKHFNNDLIVSDFSNKKLQLTLDLRIQSIIHEELEAGIKMFHAKGGNAILIKTNGEILAIVSLPDFDPNNLKKYSNSDMFNRNTLGVFEQGSIMKVVTAAIALDSGSSTPGSIFDASTSIKVGKFSITDFKGKNRPLTLAEAIVFSSNIACAKIAQKFGTKIQKEYFKKLGLLERLHLELPEVGAPLIPKDWTEISSMTIAYGYGIALSPLQVLATITSITNGGIKINPHLVLQEDKTLHERVVSEKTSKIVRELMRGVVLYGTARKASVDGVDMFGKTGTAYKRKGRKGYGNQANRDRLTSFVGGFPLENPKYMLLVSLDSPQGDSSTHGYATAGWNVAPIAKNIISRIISLISDGNLSENKTLSIQKYLKLN